MSEKSMKKAEEVRTTICKMIWEDGVRSNEVDKRECEIIAQALDEAYQEGRNEAIEELSLWVRVHLNNAKYFDYFNNEKFKSCLFAKDLDDKIRSLKQKGE